MCVCVQEVCVCVCSKVGVQGKVVGQCVKGKVCCRRGPKGTRNQRTSNKSRQCRAGVVYNVLNVTNPTANVNNNT